MPIFSAMSFFSSSLRPGFFSSMIFRARLHQFAIFSKHTSEYDVAQIGGVTFSPGDRENLFEMQCLRRANDVPDRVRFQLVDTIIDRGEIGRSVIESAVPFANDQRLISQLRIIVEEHDYGAFADLSYPGLEQAIHDAGQPVVVKTFAALKVVADIEQPVNALEILHRKRDA